MVARRKEWMINLASIGLRLMEAQIKSISGCEDGQYEQEIEELTEARREIIQKRPFEELTLEELENWFNELNPKKNNMKILCSEMAEEERKSYLEEIKCLYGELVYRKDSPSYKMDSREQQYQYKIAINELYIAWLYAR